MTITCPSGWAWTHLEQALRTRPVTLQRGRMEQIDTYAARVAALGPCRLARSARTEEIEAPVRRIEKSIHERHIESQYGAIASRLQLRERGSRVPTRGGYASSKSERSRYIMTVPCSSPSWYQESGQYPQRLKPHFS